MSTDNGIYIAHFAHDDSWRVIEIQNIENLNYYKSCGPEDLKEWGIFYGKGYPARSYNEAMSYAHALENAILISDFPVLEYGVSSIGEGPDIGPSKWKAHTDQLYQLNPDIFRNFIIEWGTKLETGSFFKQTEQVEPGQSSFWMVWNPKVGYPTVRHASFKEAETEAIRLANKENMYIYILQCTHMVHITKPREETLELK